MTDDDRPIGALRLSAYVVPTETDGQRRPESDGTATWDSTGVLIAEVEAGDTVGFGYAYGAASAALAVARELLAPVVVSAASATPAAANRRMLAAARNAGVPGVTATAISAIDIALHDLQARMLGIPLLHLLDAAHDRVMAYGSGGFTDYDDETLARQLGGWAQDGLRAVKLKIGTDPAADPRRVAAARQAIGDAVALFADANGAFHPRAALGAAAMLADHGVTWFEEPVSSDDLDGLHRVRDSAPAGMDIAAGEYGYTARYFHAMLAADAVDVLQADATRCGGVTGFRSAAAQAEAAGVPLSAHTAPAIHATLGAALGAVHVEYFHDHALIERRFFDGVPALDGGDLVPDPTAPGHGLILRRADAEPFLVDEWRSS